MTDLQNIEPLDVQLTPVATEMVNRHLLMCATAGLPVTAESLCKAAVHEVARMEGTPAEAAFEQRWNKYIHAQIQTHVERGGTEIAENDEALKQFIFNQQASFYVIHYLANVVKRAS